MAAEFADLLLGLVAGAFADGEHGDDGGDAEDDAEGGEHGAEFVEPEAFHSERHRAPEVLGRGEEAEDGAVGEHFWILDFGFWIADCGLRIAGGV